MLFNIFSLSSLFIASALALAEPAPYKVGMMSLNSAFGLSKRQAGYAPSQTFCGPGADCAASCGADYITCASNDGELHCFDPVTSETCCPDGTGNSCSDGYYCTSDSSGGTWCCPNGMDLASCAAAYSLTGALSSEAPTSTPSSAPSSSPAPVSASTSLPTEPPSSSSPPTTSSLTAYSASTTTESCDCTESTTSAPTYTSAKNATTPTTTTSKVQFTGGASDHAVNVGLPALALAAGALLVL